MEINWVLVIGSMVGGIIAIWILQTLIDVLVTSRMMDDPVNGKVLATISAYIIACLLYSLGANSIAGFLYYLPGALLIGAFEVRKGNRMREQLAGSDPSSEFE